MGQNLMHKPESLAEWPRVACGRSPLGQVTKTEGKGTLLRRWSHMPAQQRD